MGRHRVSVAEVNQLVVELRRLAEYCDSLLGEIDSAAGAASASWSGDAAAQFRELHAEWAHGAELMAAGMQDIAGLASGASTHYDAVADVNKSGWS